MELQHFHLATLRSADFNGILSLMQLQNNYINQVVKVIYQLCTDINIVSNIEFQEFTSHFTRYMQHQAVSEGYSKAIHAIQVYHYVLLERLLDDEILAAAEQLELAISHLEISVTEVKVRINPQIILLSQGINLLEETQLKIIETLEGFLEAAKPFSLQN